jgi:hypothetical protein
MVLAILLAVAVGTFGGLIPAFESSVAVVIHLTNAFVLAVVVTCMISFADSLDKAPTAQPLERTRPG